MTRAIDVSIVAVRRRILNVGDGNGENLSGSGSSDETSSEEDGFINDVEALLVSEKEDKDGDDTDVDNPERLDLS